jgi:hypothetical protein
MPSHSKSHRIIAVVAVFILAFTVGVVVASRLGDQASDDSAKVYCACHLDIWGICRPWHPPLVCEPV